LVPYLDIISRRNYYFDVPILQPDDYVTHLFAAPFAPKPRALWRQVNPTLLLKETLSRSLRLQPFVLVHNQFSLSINNIVT
jgi:hypothetical protein